MCAVAQGFDFGTPTGAQRDPIARLERLPIRSLDRDVARHTQRAGNGAIRCDFGRHGNLLGQVRLDIGFAFFEGLGVRAGRAALDHGHDLRSHLGVGGFGNHLFDVGHPIPAKA